MNTKPQQLYFQKHKKNYTLEKQKEIRYLLRILETPYGDTAHLYDLNQLFYEVCETKLYR